MIGSSSSSCRGVDYTRPACSVLVINVLTLVVAIQTRARLGGPDILLPLIVFQYWAACVNQGFLLRAYFPFWQLIDYACAFVLGCVWLHVAMRRLPFLAVFPLAVVGSGLNVWQITARTRKEFVARVNWWHLHVCLCLIVL